MMRWSMSLPKFLLSRLLANQGQVEAIETTTIPINGVITVNDTIFSE